MFILITAIASGISPAAASSALNRGLAVRGPGGEGTVAAKRTTTDQPAVKHAAASAPATATGALSTVITEQVHGGYTAAGIGMRNLGYGTISVAGVPAGATVKSATLLWDVLADQADPTFAQGTINGSPIAGAEWASGASPCWPVARNWSYEADVTSLVTGNGSYSLAGFATGESDGADPWNAGSASPLLEGASLVVVYQLASMPEASIQIAAGATETDSGSSASATLDGFTVTAPATAKTTYIVADGQETGNTASFDGATVPSVGFPGADPQAVPSYSLGNLWDTATTDVSSLTSPGDTSAALSVTGNGDCLVWVGQVLAVSGAAPRTYVALGDSYSSGEANPPFYPQAGKCDRSEQHAWPELLADEDSSLSLAAELACSGAHTSALTKKFRGQKPQLTAMQPLHPAVVTVTMGGNDVGFAHIIAGCYIPGINCISDGQLAAAYLSIHHLSTYIAGKYRKIKAAAPRAKIVVVGYPRLFPRYPGDAQLHCGWLAPDEQLGLNYLASRLDGTLQAGAKAAGVQFVSTFGAFKGHELCTGHSWVHAVLGDGVHNVQYSAHPLLQGQEAMAAIVKKATG